MVIIKQKHLLIDWARVYNLFSKDCSVMAMPKRKYPRLINAEFYWLTEVDTCRRHRIRLGLEFDNLAEVLPFEQSVRMSITRDVILKCAISYIRVKNHFRG